MNQLRNIHIVMTAWVACFLAVMMPAAFAQSPNPNAQYYPEASLTQIYTQEQIEQKKAEELEAKAVQQQDLYEKKKREVERQIAAHRFQIEGLKMSQEKAQSELESISVNLQHVNGDLASYQSEHQQLEESTKATVQYLETQRSELADKQKKVDQELVALTEARKKAEREVYEMGMEIEKYKVNIAKDETKLQEAETRRAALEADEMKVRGEWMQTKMAAAEQMRQRDEALAQLADAKKRFDVAQKELSDAKRDLASAEKARNEASKKSQAMVSQYEHDILNANKARIGAEADRIRMEAEVAKVQDYASRIKDSRDQAIDQKNEAEGLVLKSSLALESARSALSRSVEKSDQALYKSEKAQHQARGLAAAAQAADLVDGGRVWITTSDCKAYSKPSSKSPTGFFGSGKRLLGKDHGSKWVEIMNGTGASVYVPSDCGKYDN